MTAIKQWLHVPGELNPADCASRGCLPSQLISHSLWWNGPEFLTDRSFQIPTLNDVQTDVEVILLNALGTVDKVVSFLPHVSSFYRLKRIVALCLRFVNSGRNRKRFSGPITANEIDCAELVILKIVQRESLGKEIETLKNNKCVHRASKFIKLSPFMENDGLLRVGGRLKNAKLPFGS